MSRTDPIRFTIGVGDNDSAYPIAVQIEDKEHFVTSFEDADRIVNVLNEQLCEAGSDLGNCLCILCPFSSGPTYLLVKDAETVLTVLDTFVSYHEELEEWVQEGDEEEDYAAEADDEDVSEYLEFINGAFRTH